MNTSYFQANTHLHVQKQSGRAIVAAPLNVYTNVSKGNNGRVKMRPLTLPGREQVIHSPDRGLSNGTIRGATWIAFGDTREPCSDEWSKCCVHTGNDREASQERIASNGYASTSSIINVQTVESKPFSKPVPAVDIGPTYAGKLTAYCAQSRSSPAVISTLHHPSCTQSCRLQSVY